MYTCMRAYNVSGNRREGKGEGQEAWEAGAMMMGMMMRVMVRMVVIMRVRPRIMMVLTGRMNMVLGRW